MVTKESVLEVLKGAKKLLSKEEVWCQGEEVSFPPDAKEGKYSTNEYTYLIRRARDKKQSQIGLEDGEQICSLGAINIAAINLSPIKVGVPTRTIRSESRDTSRAAEKYLVKSLPHRAFASVTDGEKFFDVPDFNDDSNTEHRDVLKAFSSAILAAKKDYCKLTGGKEE